jgi:hypothetical protein
MIWIGVESSIGLDRVLTRDAEIVTDYEGFKARMIAWQGAELLHFEQENTFDTAHLRFDSIRWTATN